MRPAVLLLPGMMLDHRMWRHQRRALAHLADVTVPGLLAETSFSAMASSVLGSAPHRFHLAGFSLGAILALELWRQAPGRILSLSLIGLNPQADSPARREKRLAQIARAQSGGLEDLMVENFLPLYFSSANTQRSDLKAEVLAMARDLGPEIFTSQSLAQMGRPCSWATFPTISVPTEIVCGKDDVVTPVERHQLIAHRVSGSRLHIVEGAGHMVTLEQPGAVSSILINVLKFST